MKQRKLYLSFAGAGNYTPVSYKNEKLGIDHYSQFAQVATAKAVAKDFGPDDAIIIFTTDKSVAMYWADEEGKPRELQRQLLELNLACSLKNQHINSGSNEADIWEMFTTIFDCINENDIVYFDVTSGFRSQPLLTLPLINYAKFLKNVTVAGIYYGNFQGAGEDAPVWDLTDFSKLQDWTNNANIFLRTGNAKRLAEQIEGEGESLQDVKQGLERFSEFTLVNRGMDIYGGSEIVQLSKDLEAVEAATDPAEKAVVPILMKVKDQFVDYQENSSINGFHAVRWCIQNGLIQQAATLLEEFIVTYVMTTVGLDKKLASYGSRSMILKMIRHQKGYANGKTGLSNKEQTRLNAILAIPNISSLGEIIENISNPVRNDVNHAGFRDSPNPRSYDEIRTIVIDEYNRLCSVLNADGHDLPNL